MCMPGFDPNAFAESILSWRPRWWRWLRARIAMARARRRAAGLDDVVRCRICGCTDDLPCPGGCAWVPDPELVGDICSTCEPALVDELLDEFLEELQEPPRPGDTR